MGGCTLRCDVCTARAMTTVEVLAPEIWQACGLRSRSRTAGRWNTSDLCLNAGTLSGEKRQPRMDACRG